MKTKVLMVCLGNICRSPLAEGILKSKVDPEKVYVDSAGTGDYNIGQQPDERSVQIAENFGLDITEQRGRQFSQEDFDNFDHIYVMDIFNYDDVIAHARNKEDEKKVELILDKVFPGEKVDIPDPYQGGMQGFERVYQMLEEACSIIASELEKEQANT